MIKRSIGDPKQARRYVGKKPVKLARRTIVVPIPDNLMPRLREVNQLLRKSSINSTEGGLYLPVRKLTEDRLLFQAFMEQAASRRGRGPNNTVSILRKKLGSHFETRKNRTTEIVTEVRNEIVPQLIAFTRHSNAYVREQAARLLNNVAPVAQVALNPLGRRLLNEKDITVKTHLLEAYTNVLKHTK